MKMLVFLKNSAPQLTQFPEQSAASSRGREFACPAPRRRYALLGELSFLFFCILILVFTTPTFAQPQDCGKSDSFVVFDENNGNVLFEENANNAIYPASLVKLMTLYLTFEALERHKITMQKILTVSARGEEISNVNKINTLHLKEGDKMTVREAIQGVIVKSFNESAVTLAEAVSDNEWEFVRKMNEKAQKLGMNNTSFRNASGLHEDGQYTTGYDLARLSSAIKKDFPQYYPLFALKQFTYHGAEYKTRNHILVDYKGAEGLKTGFTNAAGFNLISAARKNNHRVVSVLLGCATYQQRDQMTKELLDEAFQKISQNPKPSIVVRLTKGFNYSAKEKKKDDYEEEMRFGMRLDN